MAVNESVASGRPPCEPQRKGTLTKLHNSISRTGRLPIVDAVSYSLYLLHVPIGGRVRGTSDAGPPGNE